MVAYAWYLPKEWSIHGWIKVILGQKVYAASAYVATEYRGRKIAVETQKFAYPALASLGFTGVISFIEHLNQNSLRSIRNTPRTLIGRVFYVRLLGLVVYCLDGRWGVGFWNRRHPLELRVEDLDHGETHLMPGPAHSDYNDQ